MHYYTLNIGDYARDTGHLSALEHGVYRLLLDWCYLNEKPISTAQAIKVSRGNPDITQSVLSEFFCEENGLWAHKRVEKEVAAYRDKADRSRNNGQKGGRPAYKQPEHNLKEPSGFSKDNPSESETNLNRKPLTINQSTNQPNKNLMSVPDDPMFLKFWETWPNTERRTSKAKCLEVWRRRKLVTVADKIINHVTMLKNTDTWKTGYQPAPLTYLNQSRWLDDTGERIEAKQPWQQGNTC